MGSRLERAFKGLSSEWGWRRCLGTCSSSGLLRTLNWICLDQGMKHWRSNSRNRCKVDWRSGSVYAGPWQRKKSYSSDFGKQGLQFDIERVSISFLSTPGAVTRAKSSAPSALCPISPLYDETSAGCQSCVNWRSLSQRFEISFFKKNVYF